MIRYEEKKLMRDVTAAELSKADAKKLTQKIKSAVDELWALLVRAHEGKAWKALGYQTWEAYVKAEFGMSRAHAYRLLDQGEVIEAVREAAGVLSPMGDISERDARHLKPNLPAVVEDIRTRVESGEEPTKAVAEVVEAKRAEKAAEKAARDDQQAEHDRQRQEHADGLPDYIKASEAAKAEAIAARKSEPVDVDALIAELEELRESNAALEAEVAALRADNAKWEAMRVQFEQGGFEKVIAGKDEVIRGLQTRVESESREKVRNLNSLRGAMKKLEALGQSRNLEIDLDACEAENG